MRMDENKLKELRRIEYKVLKCCGNCEYRRIEPNVVWGTCKLHQYTHTKHEGGAKTGVRELSINKYGICDRHFMSWTFMAGSEHFKEFLD